MDMLTIFNNQHKKRDNINYISFLEKILCFGFSIHY